MTRSPNKWNHALCSLLSLVAFTQHNAFEIHHTVVCNWAGSCLLLGNIPLYRYIIMCLFTYQLKDICIFQFLTTINKAMTYISVQIFLWTQVFTSVGYDCENTRSYSKCTFNSARNYQFFPNWHYHFEFSSAMYENSSCSTFLSSRYTCFYK